MGMIQRIVIMLMLLTISFRPIVVMAMPVIRIVPLHGERAAKVSIRGVKAWAYVGMGKRPQ